MWQIGRQVRLEEGEEAPAQPRGYGPRLDICSEVKWRLARAANLSCHSSWWLWSAHLSRSSESGGWAANTTGQRSRFLLRWGWIPSRPLAQASICQSIPPPLHCTCLAPVVLCVVCKNTFSPAFVCLTPRVVRCVGEELACFHPPIQRALALQYRIYILLQRVVLTHPPMWSVLIGNISPPPPLPTGQKKEQHGKVWSAVPWSWTQTCRRIKKRKRKIPLWPQSLISWTKEGIEVVMYLPDKVWYIAWESVCCHSSRSVWGMFSVFEGKRRSNYTLPQTSLSNFLSGICDAQNVPEQIFSQDNPVMLFDTLQSVFTAGGIAVVTGLKPVYKSHFKLTSGCCHLHHSTLLGFAHTHSGRL